MGARLDQMNITFSPRVSNCFLFPERNPSPNPTSSRSENTPQAIPNMVRNDRSLCPHRVRRVCPNMSKMSRMLPYYAVCRFKARRGRPTRPLLPSSLAGAASEAVKGRRFGPSTSCVRSQASLDRIARNDFAIPLRAQLGCTRLRLEIHVMNAESFAVAVCPLVVVHQAPQEITLDWVALRSRTMQVREMIAQVHDTVGVLDASVSSNHIVG